MNTALEQFGFDRLCNAVESHGTQSVRAIGEAIESALLDWTATQVDDATLLIARYVGGDVAG